MIRRLDVIAAPGQLNRYIAFIPANRMLKRRIIYAAAGLVFGIVVGLWAVLISGGGHFNLPILLIISPFWFGLLLWPLWAFMAVSFDSMLSKLFFVFSMIAHFAGLVIYVIDAGASDLYWFRIGTHNPGFILFPASVLVLYLAAQVFLWVRFLSDALGSFDRRKTNNSSSIITGAI